jgi:hypothetical protein
VARSFAERLLSEWKDVVVLDQEHPVLVPFTEEESDVYFSQNEIPAARLYGLVALTCASRVGDWYPVSRFLNKGLGLLQGQCPQHGLLGRFPRSIAEALLGVLAPEPIKVKSLNARLPSYWDGKQFNSYPKLETFVFGESFVVGSGFEFKKIW